MKRPGILTYVTVALLALFGIADLAAELTSDGRKGSYGETFSTFIAHLDRRSWVYRVIIGTATLVLFTHLTFQFP